MGEPVFDEGSGLVVVWVARRASRSMTWWRWFTDWTYASITAGVYLWRSPEGTTPISFAL